MLEKEVIDFKFRFNEIKTLRFFIDNRPDAVRDLSVDGYQVRISGANFVNIEEEILGFDIAINLTTNDDKKIPVCELIQRISFDVKDLNNFVEINEKEITIHEFIISHLFSLSISSTRGVLHEKTIGSIIEGFILPPVNVKDIIENMKVSKTS